MLRVRGEVMAGKSYHGAKHRRLGTPVVRAAYADPDHRCPRCGKTYAEAVEVWGKTAARWIRGHKVRAQHATSSADYQAEHARCSAGEGAAVRNARSRSAFDW